MKIVYAGFRLNVKAISPVPVHQENCEIKKSGICREEIPMFESRLFCFQNLFSCSFPPKKGFFNPNNPRYLPYYILIKKLQGKSGNCRSQFGEFQALTWNGGSPRHDATGFCICRQFRQCSPLHFFVVYPGGPRHNPSSGNVLPESLQKKQ